MQGHGYPPPPGFPMMVPGGTYPHVPNGYGFPPSQPMQMPLPSLDGLDKAHDKSLDRDNDRGRSSRHPKIRGKSKSRLSLEIYRCSVEDGNGQRTVTRERERAEEGCDEGQRVRETERAVGLEVDRGRIGQQGLS
ncbi:hypothetical protein QJS04_geneDACA006788 [Acorus gramineus]|uniref:Uncharacterized protein n=1 Tax=Acorus gramineus TaxID=55184 RepID=A0AAV9AXC9_ACOGR|nr:hypothetical protein QJS04_geneDACA006788 [Acorus gramineus]